MALIQPPQGFTYTESLDADTVSETFLFNRWERDAGEGYFNDGTFMILPHPGDKLYGYGRNDLFCTQAVLTPYNPVVNPNNDYYKLVVNYSNLGDVRKTNEPDNISSWDIEFSNERIEYEATDYDWKTTEWSTARNTYITTRRNWKKYWITETEEPKIEDKEDNPEGIEEETDKVYEEPPILILDKINKTAIATITSSFWLVDRLKTYINCINTEDFEGWYFNKISEGYTQIGKSENSPSTDKTDSDDDSYRWRFVNYKIEPNRQFQNVKYTLFFEYKSADPGYGSLTNWNYQHGVDINTYEKKDLRLIFEGLDRTGDATKTVKD